MKTRNGFVSNSSSSSFIVAFPYKPKNAKEVLDIMFDGKEGSINELTYSEISTRVFNDIKSKRVEKASLKRVTEEFNQRYFLYLYNVQSNNVVIDEIYFSNKEFNNKFYKLNTWFNNKIEEVSKIKNELLKNAKNIVRVKYAVEGRINTSTGKLYTQKEIDAYSNYEKEWNKLKATNEWKDVTGKRDIIEREYFEKFSKLSDQAAKNDAKKFINDNAEKYIFIVDYGNNVDPIMEHSDIFRNVLNIHISHH
jgi:hypothetical protein